MMDIFEKKIRQAGQGKELFRKMFEIENLSVEDVFLVVLTDNEECIHYGMKYLSDFMELHHKRNLYVFADQESHMKSFPQARSVLCERDELESLADYLNIFHKKEEIETRIIFLTDKDDHGLEIEELLERGEFSLEEYVAISLYHLKGLTGGV